MLRSSSWLNDTPFCRTAVNSLTGTEISPKLIAPLQIDLAMGGRYLFLGSTNPLMTEPVDPGRWRTRGRRAMVLG